MTKGYHTSPSLCRLRVDMPSNDGETMMTSYDYSSLEINQGPTESIDRIGNVQHRIHLSSDRLSRSDMLAGGQRGARGWAHQIYRRL